MSASSPKEAIDAINACAELSDPEKAAAIASAIRDSNVAQGIVATPVSLRVATIRQLLASSQASSSAQGAGVSGWLRDLTREGVEANPGPALCQHAGCDCAMSRKELTESKENDGYGLQLNGLCPGCTHLVSAHQKEALVAGVAHSAAASLLSAVAASRTVGRVLTWMAEPQQSKKAKTAAGATAAGSSSLTGAGTWVVSGQCVCVADPRILLTATHVCFDGQTQHIIRVLLTPADGGAAQSFPAKLIRYSGLMDVSVLLLDSHASPFVPASIVPAASPLLAALQSAALVCFPLAVDLLAQPSGQEEKLVLQKIYAMVKAPQVLPGQLTGVMPRTTAHKGISRSFTLVCSNYISFAGCSGGGVFSQQLGPTGALQLLGVHTEAIYQTGQSQLSIVSVVEGEFDGHAAANRNAATATADKGAACGAGPAAEKAPASEAAEERLRSRRSTKRGSMFTATDNAAAAAADADAAAAEATAASGASSTLQGSATGSTTPEDTPTKKVQLKLADEVQHKSALAVFIAAETALMQHAAWLPAVLAAEATATPGSSSAAAPMDLDVGIARLKEESRQQASPCFFRADEEKHALYD